MKPPGERLALHVPLEGSACHLSQGLLLAFRQASEVAGAYDEDSCPGPTLNRGSRGRWQASREAAGDQRLAAIRSPASWHS